MADKLVRFGKGAWDVCWVDTGRDDDLYPFLHSIPAGAKKVIEGHIKTIVLLGPRGQVKDVEGQPGLFEIREIYMNCQYRVFASRLRQNSIGIYIYWATATRKKRRRSLAIFSIAQ